MHLILEIYLIYTDIVSKKKYFINSKWNKIIKSSTKLITFVDHPRHKRYFKTSVFGLKSKNKNDDLSQMLSLNLDGLLDTNSCTSTNDDTNFINDKIMMKYTITS